MIKKIVLFIFILLSVSCEQVVNDNCNINCLENEECAIYNHKEICVCKNGFSKKNNTCKRNEVDKCENIDCKENSSCLEGACVCNTNYVKDENNICILEQVENKLKLRLLASNLTSGNEQKYEEPGINILKALKADIIMIQEFNYKNNSDNSIKNFVKTTFGDNFYFFRGTPNGNGDIPNGVISKYTITKSGEWVDPRVDDRKIAWSIIDLPKEMKKDLFIVSVHLKAGEADSQINAANLISQKIYNHRLDNPDKYFYVVGGDFNGDASLCRDNRKNCNGFKRYNKNNILYTDSPDPYSEYKKNTTTNASSTKQLDFILVDYNLKKLQVSTDYCKSKNDCKKYPYGLVFRVDGDNYSQKDLDKYFYPVEVGDSEVMQMQHMGVVKDFLFK